MCGCQDRGLLLIEWVIGVGLALVVSAMALQGVTALRVYAQTLQQVVYRYQERMFMHSTLLVDQRSPGHHQVEYGVKNKRFFRRNQGRNRQYLSSHYTINNAEVLVTQRGVSITCDTPYDTWTWIVGTPQEIVIE